MVPRFKACLLGLASGRTGLSEDGAVLIEFALLAVPFFALIFAILETSITFLAQQVLDSALQDATRSIRTGQSQTSWNTDEFPRRGGAADCESGPERVVK